jgi:hypothetical protein
MVSRIFFRAFSILFFSLLFSQESNGQKLIYNGKDSMSTVVVDTAVLVIGHKGFTSEDFINEILRDTGFYQAFRNLKSYSMISSENIKTFTKKGLIESHITRKILHDHSGAKYSQKILSSVDSGEVYRHSGEYRLFTLKMFSYIFENEKNSDLAESSSTVDKGNEGYKQKLKRLIFQPGTPIEGIPFISGKTKIFSPEMRPFYNYSFSSAVYYGTTPVYRFTVSAKPEYRKDGEVMIKDLVTIFDKKNFKILGRFINMQYNNPFFSFDVRMNIETRYFGEDQLPVLIQYAGNWDIPFKKKETAAFIVQMSDIIPKGTPLSH